MLKFGPHLIITWKCILKLKKICITEDIFSMVKSFFRFIMKIQKIYTFLLYTNYTNKIFQIKFVISKKLSIKTFFICYKIINISLNMGLSYVVFRLWYMFKSKFAKNYFSYKYQSQKIYKSREVEKNPPPFLWKNYKRFKETLMKFKI